MRINELEVTHFRGLVSFTTNPNGKSITITGDNGTGKSGVIDALDFLLTGQVRRLTGTGSGDLNLDTHGKHIDKDAKSSLVIATIQLSGAGTVRVRRSLYNKSLEKMEGSNEDFELLKSKLISGQFMLSRRELLKYIASEGGKRSQDIQELLDLSDLEKVRTDLASSFRSLEKDVTIKGAFPKSIEGTLDGILGLNQGSWDARLLMVNTLRKTLGSPDLEKWAENTDVLFGVSAVSASGNIITKTTFISAVSQIEVDNFHEPTSATGEKLFDKFISTLDTIQKIESIREKLESHSFIEIGLKRIGINPKCPLCDTAWEIALLKKHLTEKMSLATKAKEVSSDFEKYSKSYISQIVSQKSKLIVLEEHLGKLGKNELKAQVGEEIKSTDTKITLFSDMTQSSLIKDVMTSPKGHLFIPSEGMRSLLKAVEEEIPESSPRELAYRTLVQVDTSYKNFVKSLIDYHAAKKRFDAVKVVKENFETIRGSYFESLYKEIENDFGKFYAFINEEDEARFIAQLQDKGNKLNLLVDFFERGFFPPHALHSEGHQDSMGVCLYLALMKKLKKESFTVALLDDVMMSIDNGHRRRLCELLKKEFPNTQFFITTHDPAWASQLSQFKVTTKANTIHFRSWSLEHGPVYDSDSLWDLISKKIVLGSISEAAAMLRRTCEQAFHELCVNFEAKVTYNESMRWDLGELQPAAIAAFKSILSKAQSAANSRNERNTATKLSALQATLSDNITKSKVDEWQMNPAIHYNSWVNFSKNEMTATATGMRNLIESFNCSCGSPLSLMFPSGSYKPMALSCPCGKSHFTLIEKTD